MKTAMWRRRVSTVVAGIVTATGLALGPTSVVWEEPPAAADIIAAEGTPELVSGPVGGSPASGNFNGESVDVSYDGMVIAYRGHGDGSIRVRERTSTPGVGVTELIADWGLGAAISPNGRYVAFTSTDDLQAPTGGEATDLVYRYDRVTDVAVEVSAGRPVDHELGIAPKVADSGRVVWVDSGWDLDPSPGCGNAEYLVWYDGSGRETDPRLAFCMPATYAGTRDLDLAADGDRVAVTSAVPHREEFPGPPQHPYWGSSAVMYSIDSLDMVGLMEGTHDDMFDPPRAVAISGDGRWMVANFPDGRVDVFDSATQGTNWGAAGTLTSNVSGSTYSSNLGCYGPTLNMDHDGSLVTCGGTVTSGDPLFVAGRRNARAQLITSTAGWMADISGDGRTVAYASGGADLSVRGTSLDDVPPPTGVGPLADEELLGPNGALKYQCPCQGWKADPVDTRAGDLFLPLPGLAIAGRGPGLGFSLAYNSLKHDVDGPVGEGFDISLDMALTVDGDVATVRQETGATVSFSRTGWGWEAPPRFTARLRHEPDGTWTFLRRNVEVFRFDADGRLISIGDLNGYQTTVSYVPSTDHIDEVTDSAGRTLTFTYTGDRIDTITDPASRVVDFDYVGDQLRSYTDASGGVWTFGYDLSGPLQWWRKPARQPAGPTMEVGYDGSGRVIWQTDELDREWEFHYDTPAAGATSVVEPDGDVRVDWYTDGRREKVTHAYGTADAYDVTYTYDPDTLAPLTMTDRGRTWTYGYDSAGNRDETTDPTGRETRSTYNSRDQVIRSEVNRAKPGDPEDWVVTTFDYDANGNLLEVTEDLGGADEAVTELRRTDTAHPDDVRQVVDARGKTWAFEYHATRGDRTKATDPVGNVTTWVTDTMGRVTSTVAPEGNKSGGTPVDHTTTFGHDAAGRVDEAVNPVGDRTEWDYDANGNLREVRTDLGTGDTDPELTTYTYDDADQLIAVTEASKVGPTVTPLSTTEYGYRLDGSREWWENGNDQRWTFTYDHANRLVSETDPNGEATCYTYSAAGGLATVIRPDAGPECTAATRPASVTYGYDGAGRPTSVDFADPATPDVSGITYDGAGRRLTATRAGGDPESWTWDRRGRLTGHTDDNGRSTGYGWDDTSNLETITYPGSVGTVTRGYDDAGRWTSVTDWTGDTTTFAYDRNGNWTTTTFPVSTGNVDTRTYDRADQLASITWTQASTTLGALTYTRTGAGTKARDVDGLVDVITATGAAGTNRDYGYDGRDQLTDPGTGGASLAVDPAGNLTETEDGRLQVFDPAQQLCWTSPTATSGTCTTPPSDATTYGHDARGNRTWEAPDSGAPTTYGYDAADRLASVDLPASGTEGQFEAVGSSRVADTRTGVGVCDGGTCAQLTASQTVKIQVTGRGNIPSSGVAAVTGNVGIPNPGTTGYVRMNPHGTAAAATLNFRSGISSSGFAVIPVAVDGTITVWASAATHVVLDLSGYYTDPTASGDTYVPLTAGRLVDTRSGTATGVCNSGACSTLTNGSTTVIDIAGHAGVPASGVTGVVLSASVLNPSGRGTLAVHGAGSVALSFMTGETGNDTLVVPLSSGQITVSINANADLVLDVAGYYTAPPPGGDGALQLVPTTRAIDTTDGTGTCDPGPCARLGAGDRVDLQLAGTSSVPAGATAVLAWVSALDPTATGELRLAPDGSTGAGTLGAATVTFQANHDTDALVLVPVDLDGMVTLGTSQAIDVAVDVLGYVGAPTDTWTYGYDSTGLRTTKRAPSGDVTEFAWDAAGGLPVLLAQYDGADATYLIYGPGGLPLKQIEPGGSELWYHQDHLGSTRMTTTSAGAEHARYGYDAYGTKTVDTTSSGARPLLTYAGQHTDPETGLQYLRARFYDPTTGQFLTRDPLVHSTEEPHGYASSDPINKDDPLGLNACEDYGAGHYDRGNYGCVETYYGPGSSPPPPRGYHPEDYQGRGAAPGAAGASEITEYPRPTSNREPDGDAAVQVVGTLLDVVAVSGAAICGVSAGAGCALAFAASVAGAGVDTLEAYRACTEGSGSDCALGVIGVGLNLVPTSTNAGDVGVTAVGACLDAFAGFT